MGFWLILAVFLLAGLCLARGKADRRRFLSGVVSLVYIPIATIAALTKNYK
jgi:hypothetical protein